MSLNSGKDGGFSGMIGSTSGVQHAFTAHITAWAIAPNCGVRKTTGPGDGGTTTRRLGDNDIQGEATGESMTLGTLPDSGFGAPIVTPMQRISGTITLISHMDPNTQQPQQYISFPAVVTVSKVSRNTAENDKWQIDFTFAGTGPSTIQWNRMS